MKKVSFSPEILCLFFIISVSILFGKILINIKTTVGEKINQFMPQPTIQVEYQAYSYREKDIIELDELNIIRNIDDLNNFNDKIKEKEIKWLNDKLKEYQDDYFDDKSLVVICLVNDNNVLSNRINSVTKKNNYITIGLSKREKDFEASKQYTWLSIIEITDKDSKVVLNIEKV